LAHTALFALTGEQSVVNEYALTLLKKASPPSEAAVVRIEESHRGERVEHGILFTYAGRGVRAASIAGDFSSWKECPMIRGKNGVWYYFLSENDQTRAIRYKFNIDGIWTDDPTNSEKVSDGNGSYCSIAQTSKKGESKQVSYRILNDGSIEFRHFDSAARFISIAGDFNNWNPENDILSRGNDNIWRVKKRLPKGKFRYKLVVDGEWTIDVYNEQSAADGAGGVCSLIVIK